MAGLANRKEVCFVRESFTDSPGFVVDVIGWAHLAYLARRMFS